MTHAIATPNTISVYTPDWPEIASIIKELAGWKCENCGHPHDPRHGYTLTVHHIDLNPQNNQQYNLAALCQRCHLHYQRPLILLQLSFYPMPPWQFRYFRALQSKSSGMKNDMNHIIPPISLVSLLVETGKHKASQLKSQSQP